MVCPVSDRGTAQIAEASDIRHRHLIARERRAVRHADLDVTGEIGELGRPPRRRLIEAHAELILCDDVDRELARVRDMKFAGTGKANGGLVAFAADPRRAAIAIEKMVDRIGHVVPPGCATQVALH